MSRRKPKPGDLVEVVWIDHAGSDVDEGAECPVFMACGYYKEERKSNGQMCLFIDRNVRVKANKDFTVGWDSFPLGAVLEVKVR